ncbi:MAG: hypothetical protein HY921_05270 [Elusimicrobia bacterium]|nr:hypothetical protein [Elusimicrobiota bacterium]
MSASLPEFNRRLIKAMNGGDPILFEELVAEVAAASGQAMPDMQDVARRTLVELADAVKRGEIDAPEAINAVNAWIKPLENIAGFEETVLGGNMLATAARASQEGEIVDGLLKTARILLEHFGGVEAGVVSEAVAVRGEGAPAPEKVQAPAEALESPESLRSEFKKTYDPQARAALVGAAVSRAREYSDHWQGYGHYAGGLLQVVKEAIEEGYFPIEERLEALRSLRAGFAPDSPENEEYNRKVFQIYASIALNARNKDVAEAALHQMRADTWPVPAKQVQAATTALEEQLDRVGRPIPAEVLALNDTSRMPGPNHIAFFAASPLSVVASYAAGLEWLGPESWLAVALPFGLLALVAGVLYLWGLQSIRSGERLRVLQAVFRKYPKLIPLAAVRAVIAVAVGLAALQFGYYRLGMASLGLAGGLGIIGLVAISWRDALARRIGELWPRFTTSPATAPGYGQYVYINSRLYTLHPKTDRWEEALIPAHEMAPWQEESLAQSGERIYIDYGNLYRESQGKHYQYDAEVRRWVEFRRPPFVL